MFGRRVHLRIDLARDARRGPPRWPALRPSGTTPAGTIGSRLRLRGAFVGRLVQLLVVGQRVRIRSSDSGVNERRAFVARGHTRRPRTSRDNSRGSRCRRYSARTVRGTRTRASRCRRRPSAPRPAPRSRSRCPRRRRRAADRSRQARVQRLPEFPFAGRAVADRQVHDLVLAGTAPRAPRWR